MDRVWCEWEGGEWLGVELSGQGMLTELRELEGEAARRSRGSRVERSP